MTPSIERKLTSAEIRALLPEVLDGDAGPDTEGRLADLFAELAGGDMELAHKAVNRFFGELLTPEASKKGAVAEAVATEMLSAFLTGRLDLIGITEKAEFLWCASHSEQEAA